MGFFFAWSVGEGIIIWRWVKNGAPPTPGALLLPSALYLGLAVLAEYDPARTAATSFAWALDAAVLLQVLGKDPKQKTGWPPAMINDPTVILPGGASNQAELTAYTAGPGAPAGAGAGASTGSGAAGQPAPGFQLA